MKILSCGFVLSNCLRSSSQSPRRYFSSKELPKFYATPIFYVNSGKPIKVIFKVLDLI